MPPPHTEDLTNAASQAASHAANHALLFAELGAVIIGLSLLARLALRFGLTPIPLYLIAGLLVGEGGFHPLEVSKEFISTGAGLGVVLLLFMLGLEYSASELMESLRRGMRAGLLDCALNFLPGFLFAKLIGWGTIGAILLGGVTWISSSSIIAKVLSDLGRLGNGETPAVLSVLVMEDLAMAVYLPLVAVLLLGQGFWAGVKSISVALVAVLVIMGLALRFGKKLSRVIAHESDEVLLLSILGLVLVVAGVAQKLQVSDAIGAFLVGLALSGAVAEKAHHLIGPLRDLFAATFFFFVGLSIDPKQLPGALPLAFALAFITTLTKIYTGWKTAEWDGRAPRGRMRAGMALTSRGEFSVVIAGLAATAAPTVTVESALGPISAAYVLILAVAGPMLARFAENFSVALESWEDRRETAKLAREAAGAATEADVEVAE